MSAQNSKTTGTPNSSEYELELKERLEELIRDGKQVEATSKSININDKPGYLDEERIPLAHKVYEKYYANGFYASLVGLVLLVQIESILIPLLKTGKSRTIPDLFDRYLLTAKSMKSIYFTRFYEQNSEGWKYLNMVRGMHMRIHQFMKELESNFSEQQQQQQHDGNAKKHLWVNQYDMALTSFAFAGCTLLWPKKCGAHNVKKNELESIAYYWQLLSYYLGIEERFSLFVYYDDIQKQTAYLRLVFNHIKSTLDESRPEVGMRMAQGIITAFEGLSFGLPFNIYDHEWAPLFSLSGLKEPKPYTISERLKSLLFRFVFNVLFRSEMIRRISNRVFIWHYERFCKTSDTTREKLVKNHGHITYELYESRSIVVE